jgi:hypothetical protein
MWKEKIKDGGNEPEADLEQRLSRLVEVIKANFQRLYSCTVVPATQWNWLQ